MTFEELARIENEQEQVNKTYELFQEDRRLTWSQAARVEFLTNVRYIERYLKPGSRILDIGAGTGAYSLHFAQQGFSVSALELADENLRVFRQKITPNCPIDLVQGTALDLSRYADDSFDVVLLFGPLYHLHQEKDRQQCIAEAKRVCAPDGMLFFAFIANDMVFLTEFNHCLNYFTTGDYNKDTFQLDDFPFVFHTVDQCRQMLMDGGIQILHEVASDGISELLTDRINQLDKENFDQYLRYHFYICEKPEFLGMSNHLLFVGTAE